MKFFLKKPNQAVIHGVIDAHASSDFTYPDVGASRMGPQLRHVVSFPKDYRFVHTRQLLGTGEEVFLRAKRAFPAWRMYQLPWLELYWPDAPIVQGTNVAILGHVLGTWWLNTSRVVYTLREDGPVERFGIAYGTLAGNSLSGEERVLIEWNHSDDSVWYDLFSFSKPNLRITKLSLFYLHILQGRFARDSAQVMKRIAQESQ